MLCEKELQIRCVVLYQHSTTRPHLYPWFSCAKRVYNIRYRNVSCFSTRLWILRFKMVPTETTYIYKYCPRSITFPRTCPSTRHEWAMCESAAYYIPIENENEHTDDAYWMQHNSNPCGNVWTKSGSKLKNILVDEWISIQSLIIVGYFETFIQCSSISHPLLSQTFPCGILTSIIFKFEINKCTEWTHHHCSTIVSGLMPFRIAE